MSLAPELLPREVSQETARRVRGARRSGQRHARLVLSALGAMLLAAFTARVLLGDFTVTVPDAVRIVLGADLGAATYVLMETKLPRAVLGVLVGGAFGLGGAIFQTTLRNPLASPDLIGVSLGASAAAVVAIVPLGLAGPAVSAAAVAGAVLVSALVRLTAGPGSGHRLVLVGIGVAAVLTSVIHYVFTRADVWDAQLALRWLTGSLNAADWPTIRLLSGLLVVLAPLLLWTARSLRVLELGADTSVGLGVGPRRSDAVLLLAVLLVAVAVAAAGPIAFVSFMAGPLARACNRGRSTLLGAALTGAVLVVGADYVADYLLLDVNFPVGVVTGAFGAPFLLWLLARTGRTR